MHEWKGQQATQEKPMSGFKAADKKEFKAEVATRRRGGRLNHGNASHVRGQQFMLAGSKEFKIDVIISFASRHSQCSWAYQGNIQCLTP